MECASLDPEDGVLVDFIVVTFVQRRDAVRLFLHLVFAILFAEVLRILLMCVLQGKVDAIFAAELKRVLTVLAQFVPPGRQDRSEGICWWRTVGRERRT